MKWLLGAALAVGTGTTAFADQSQTCSQFQTTLHNFALANAPMEIIEMWYARLGEGMLSEDFNQRAVFEFALMDIYNNIGRYTASNVAITGITPDMGCLGDTQKYYKG